MSEILLQAEGLCKRYKSKRGQHQALDDVSFTLGAGEILGVVGESGSGKTTLARVVLSLIRADAGRLLWRGEDLLTMPAARIRALRPQMQMVFQNPYASFNPRRRVGKALRQAGRFFGLDNAACEARIAELLDACAIPAELLDRYPQELSGGQLQRLAIVRALLPRPSLLIADEAVSSLDVAVAEPVLDILKSLRDRYGISVLFITHDLAVVAALCDRAIVMQQGKIVESGPVAELFSAPRHSYTKALLAARPRLDAAFQAERKESL